VVRESHSVPCGQSGMGLVKKALTDPQKANAAALTGAAFGGG
jgi:hypothetical protein